MMATTTDLLDSIIYFANRLRQLDPADLKHLADEIREVDDDLDSIVYAAEDAAGLN